MTTTNEWDVQGTSPAPQAAVANLYDLVIKLKQKEAEKKALETEIKAIKADLGEAVNNQPGTHPIVTEDGVVEINVTQRYQNDIELARENLPPALFDKVTKIEEKIDTNLVKAHIEDPDVLNSIKKLHSTTITGKVV